MRIARSCTLIALLLVTRCCFAVDWWLDPERGCGKKEAWTKNHRIGNLPGCDGDLPKEATTGEIALHDAKSLLHTAERILDQNRPDGVEDLIERASDMANSAPNESRVNPTKPYYREAADLLNARLKDLLRDTGQ